MYYVNIDNANSEELPLRVANFGVL